MLHKKGRSDGGRSPCRLQSSCHLHKISLGYGINTSKVKSLKAVVNRWDCGGASLNAVPSCRLMTSDSQLVCAGLWQWVQSPGLERFEFSRAGDEWTFRGTILTLSHDAPAEAKYEIVFDRSFKTRRA